MASSVQLPPAASTRLSFSPPSSEFELALPRSVPTHRQPHRGLEGADGSIAYVVAHASRRSFVLTCTAQPHPRRCPIHIKSRARPGIRGRSGSSRIEMDRVAISRQALDHTYRACSHILGRYSRRTTPLARNEVRGKTTVPCRSGDNWRRPVQDQTGPSFWFGTI